MEKRTEVHEFILLGLTHDHRERYALFLMFLLLYLASLLGNGAILAVAIAEPRLHTPMYFFLGNLSSLDMCYSTVTVPKMLSGFLTERQAISFSGCLIQLHFFYFLGSGEGILLGVMALDRFMAICNPRRYTAIMNKSTCLLLAGATWVAGFFYALMHTTATSQLWFCGPNHVQHFLCDIIPFIYCYRPRLISSIHHKGIFLQSYESHIPLLLLNYLAQPVKSYHHLHVAPAGQQGPTTANE